MGKDIVSSFELSLLAWHLKWSSSRGIHIQQIVASSMECCNVELMLWCSSYGIHIQQIVSPSMECCSTTDWCSSETSDNRL